MDAQRWIRLQDTRDSDQGEAGLVGGGVLRQPRSCAAMPPLLSSSALSLIAELLPPRAPTSQGTYVDKKCPFTGNVSIRGRILKGIVTSTKMQRTIVIRRDYLQFVTKYRCGRGDSRASLFSAHPFRSSARVRPRHPRAR